MNINELITRVKKEKPNSFLMTDLYAYINAIESQVAEQLNRSHSGYTYTSETENDGDKVLMAKAPYDCLYISWLKAQIDYANEEYASYENNQAQHIADFQDFVDHVTRDGMTESRIPSRFINVF